MLLKMPLYGNEVRDQGHVIVLVLVPFENQLHSVYRLFAIRFTAGRGEHIFSAGVRADTCHD